MRKVDAANVAEYLVDAGFAGATARIEAKPLSGGVSNEVCAVDVNGRRLVVKQARGQLRTVVHWTSRLERIRRETAAMRLLDDLLPAGAVPEILFEDPANFLFVMTRAPDDAEVWKSRLLAGRIENDVARRAGALLGAMHERSIGRPELEGELVDQSVFDELRVDPYYRFLLPRYPDLKASLNELIAPTEPPTPVTFVHADFSPKNMLAHERGLTLVDFETAHAGDPAFDHGFFASHLFLKAIRAPERRAAFFELFQTFWKAYRDAAPTCATASTTRRAVLHAAGCALARIDGKSPVDYLDDVGRDRARRWAVAMLSDPASDWREAIARLDRVIAL